MSKHISEIEADFKRHKYEAELMRCRYCKHFIPGEGKWGKCNLSEGMLGENCHKYQWCVDFKEVEHNA